MDESTRDRFKDLIDEVGGLFSRDIDEDYRKLQMQFLEDIEASAEAIMQESVRRQDKVLEELSEQLSGEASEMPDLPPATAHLEEEYERLAAEKSDTDARLRNLMLEKEAADADRKSLEAQVSASENALVLYKEDAETNAEELQQKVVGLEEQLSGAVFLAEERSVEKEQTEERLMQVHQGRETLDASRQSLEEQVIEAEKALNSARENAGKAEDQLQQENVRLENQLSKATMLADERRQDKENAEDRLAQMTRERDALKAGRGLSGEADEGSGNREEKIDELHQRIVDLEGQLSNAVLLADERLVEKEQAEERLVLVTRESEQLELAGESQHVQIVEYEDGSEAIRKNAEKVETELRGKVAALEDQLDRAVLSADELRRENEGFKTGGGLPGGQTEGSESAEQGVVALRQRIAELEGELNIAVLLADERLVEKEQAEEKLALVNREESAQEWREQSLEGKVFESEKALDSAKERAEKTRDELHQENINLENQLARAVLLADERGQEREEAEEALAVMTREKAALAATVSAPGVSDTTDPDADEFRQKIVDLESRLRDADQLADQRLREKEQAENRAAQVTREKEALEAAVPAPGAPDTPDADVEKIADLESRLRDAGALSEQRLREKEQAENRAAQVTAEKEALEVAAPAPAAPGISDADAEKIENLEDRLRDADQLAAQRLAEKEQVEDRLIVANREKDALASAGPAREEQVAESERALAEVKENAKRAADEHQQQLTALEGQLNRAEQLSELRLKEKGQAEERLAVMTRDKEALEVAVSSQGPLDTSGLNTEKIAGEFRKRISDLERQLSDAVQLAAQRLLEKEQAEERLVLTERENAALASTGPSQEEQIRESEFALNRFKEDAEKISDDLRAKIYNLEEQLNSAVLLADKRLVEKGLADEQLIRITREKAALSPGGQLREVPVIETQDAVDFFMHDGGGIPDEFRQNIIDLKNQKRDAVVLADRRRLLEEQASDGLNLMVREKNELEAIKNALEKQREESRKLLIDLMKMQRRFQMSAGR